MVRTILTYGAPELQTKCSPVTHFDDKIRRLAQDLLETMYASSGIGLAAPQVGVDSRLIVIDLSGGQETGHQLVFANPVITQEEGSQKGEEGCLSIPGFTAIIERPSRVHVTGQDLEGNSRDIDAEDMLARAFCHEVDHLDGILYLDRTSPIKRDLIQKRIGKLLRAGEW